MFGHPHMFGCPLYVLMMFGCPLYIHNTKRACFVRLRGVHMPQYIWMCPMCLDAPCLFGCPPICLDGPICLDTSTYVSTPTCMFGQPQCLDASHIFGCTSVCFDAPICLDAPVYAWKMFGCLLYIYNTKKPCFFRVRGCPYAPHTFGYPICLDAPVCLDTPMFGCPSYFWMPPYIWWHPNIQGAAKHMEGIQTYKGCPNMWGHPTIQRGVQT